MLRRPRVLRTMIPLLLAGACAPPPVAPRVELVQPEVSTARQLEPSISVAAVRPPQKLVLDGDVGEWDSLLPPLPKPPKPGAKPGTKKTKPTEEPPPNPRDAPSRVAVAITNDAALIAAELDAPVQAGIWLGIGAVPAELPGLGHGIRNGAGFMRLECTDEDYETGKRNPPEVIAACKVVLERYAKFKAAHEARFAKVFRIDREGVRVAAADGALTLVAGAKVAWKLGAKGVTLEASMPLAAMPRVAEAPLATLRLVARAATLPKPPRPAEEWISATLPTPISFEPFGALRARVWESLPPGTVRTGYRPPSGLSYQPGDALEVECMDAGEASISSQRQTMYEKKATLGDLEVGIVTAFSAFWAIFVKGQLIDLVDVDARGFEGMVTRNGEIHILSYTPRTWVGGTTPMPPSWSVLEIAADGSHREGVEEEDGIAVNCYFDSGSLSEFVSKKVDSFGFRGVCEDSKKREGIEVTWRWDERRKKYDSTSRSYPAPKKKK